MRTPRAVIWTDAPEVGIPEWPALVTNCDDLLLAYEVAPCGSRTYAVVRFSGLVDHRLSPINDEGLGQHPYVQSGLQFYSFHEVEASPEALRWNARHWVVTFKDQTLDVVAADVAIVRREIRAVDATHALLDAIRGDAA